jgi:hypothetical protein
VALPGESILLFRLLGLPAIIATRVSLRHGVGNGCTSYPPLRTRTRPASTSLMRARKGLHDRISRLCTLFMVFSRPRITANSFGPARISTLTSPLSPFRGSGADGCLCRTYWYDQRTVVQLSKGSSAAASCTFSNLLLAFDDGVARDSRGLAFGFGLIAPLRACT